MDSGLGAGQQEPRDLGGIGKDSRESHPEEQPDSDDLRPQITLHGGRLHATVDKVELVLLRQDPPIFSSDMRLWCAFCS